MKLQQQVARFGHSTQGMPTLEVYRGSDGELVIYSGVTRATRVAKLLPGKYRLWCSIADHRARGMQAVLIVRK